MCRCGQGFGRVGGLFQKGSRKLKKIAKNYKNDYWRFENLNEEEYQKFKKIEKFCGEV